MVLQILKQLKASFKDIENNCFIILSILELYYVRKDTLCTSDNHIEQILLIFKGYTHDEDTTLW